MEKHSGLGSAERQNEVFNYPPWPKILQNTNCQISVFTYQIPIPCCSKLLAQVQALVLNLFCRGRHLCGWLGLVIMDLCALTETAKFHLSVGNSNQDSLSTLVSPNETKYSSLQFHSFWTLSLPLICLTSCQATSTVVLHIQQH